MALERSDVQTGLARAVITKVEESLGGRITYSSLTIKPFNAFVVRDLVITDDSPWPDSCGKGLSPIDTIISVRFLSGTFSLSGLLHKEGVRLSRVNMKDGMLCMTSEDNSSRSNLNRFLRAPDPPEVPVEGPSIFDIRRLSVDGFRFRFHNLLDIPYQWRGVGFNWEDLDMRARSIEGRHVRFSGGRLSFIVDHVDVTDHCGYSARHISGRAKCGIGQVLLDDIVLQDGLSDIRVPRFTMNFKNAYSFLDYVNAVRMDGKLDATTIDGRTLRYFIDALPDNRACFTLKEGCRFSGYVNDFRVDRFRFRDKSGVSGALSCRITGITDPSSMIIDTDIDKISFNPAQAESLVNSIVPSCGLDLGSLEGGVKYVFSGHADGPVGRLRADGRLTSGRGSAGASLSVLNLPYPERTTEISGSASCKDFNLGESTGIGVLGECSMSTAFRARLDGDKPTIILDSLSVSKLGVLGYEYSGIEAAGKLTGRSFDGKLICNDPNLNFLFQGVCDFSQTTNNALYRFYANLGYADLDALNLDRRGLGSKISCRVSANYTRVFKGKSPGFFKVQDILLENNSLSRDLGDINIESTDGAEGYTVSLESCFLSGEFRGSHSPASLLSDLRQLTLGRHLDALNSESDASSATGSYSIDLDFHDSRDLLSFLMPGAYVADSTSFHMDISPEGTISGALHSPRLAYGANYIKGAELEFDSNGDALAAGISDSEIKLGGLRIRESSLSAYASENDVNLALHINEGSQETNYADLFANISLSRDDTDSLVVTAQMLPSGFRLGSRMWDIDPSTVSIRSGGVQVDSFRVSNEEQEIRLCGRYSRTSRDSLVLDIRSLSLSLLGDLTGRDLEIPGSLDGSARLISGPDEEMLASVDILCDGASIKGAYVPYRDSLCLDAKLNDLNLKLLEPFLDGIASNLEGCIDGEISVSGSSESPVIEESVLALKDAAFNIDYTGARYTLNGLMGLGSDGIHLQGVNIRDSRSGSGLLSGGIRFDGFKGIILDAGVKFSDLRVLDTSLSSTGDIYGLVNADADLTITGPLDDIRIDGSVATTGSGNVHIPLNSAVASSGGELLVFKEVTGTLDPYEEMMRTSQAAAPKASGNIAVHVKADINEGVSAMLELNKSTGNVITARGDGAVQLDLQTSTGALSVTGDYNISGGNLHFEVPGIVKKEFSLKEGSSMRFNGPVKNSEMDITAIYNVKTSLATLIADTTSVSTRRPVECSIRITDKLLSPQIAFGVDVPDLDPQSRTKMTEALNTEDKVQKQFIALLVMGSFLPSEQSGVVNSANILYSNVGELMSNQLSNILQKLDIPLDLGLGYQQNQQGTDIFDVAISTQLFNNRLEIGGSVGNRQYSTSKKPYGDIVGDIDISIKLDKAGKFKLNLFSHSADEFTSFLDYSQRNGIGIAYQKEYDNFFKMLREGFKKTEEQARVRRTIMIE